MNPCERKETPQEAMSTPLLTVIVPVYNTAPYLRQCLDSICNQTYRNLEIICVDDGSKDESVEILQEYAAKDPRVVVLVQERNMGNGRARNRALDCARGVYVTFVDSDDYVSLDAYERAVPHMEGVDMVCYTADAEGYPEESVAEFRRYYTMSLSGKKQVTPELMEGIIDSVWSKVFRRSFLEENKLRFPVGLWYEDYCFKFCCLSYCKAVYMYPERLYHRIVRNDSIMGQSRLGHAKSLDRFATYDYVLSFWKERGFDDLLATMRGAILERALMQVLQYNATLRPQAKALCLKLLHKWGGIKDLQDQDLYAQVFGKKRKVFCFSSLFFTRRGDKKTYRFFGLPIVSRNKKNGQKVWRVLGIPVYRRRV